MKIVFYVGFLFFGGGFLIGFGQFTLYNGFGNIFEYIEPNNVKYTIRIDTVNQSERYIINYSYIVNSKLYNAKDMFYSSYIKETGKNIERIYYNKLFPSIIYVEDNYLDIRRSKINMIVMGFFFLFIFLIYKFADMDKWIGVYTRGEYKSSRKK
ncbi:MAG: hypothetical protein FWF52_01395 [Candidatus Azobacteroides sp.]|nr:hypothetical protein [Candidatus Azobacteroides sp.]